MHLLISLPNVGLTPISFDWQFVISPVNQKKGAFMLITDRHVFFFGKQDVFSQWHPCLFEMDGINFNCSEQAMMYYKALVFKDEESVKKILLSKNPKDQKALGRKVKNFDKGAWDKEKIKVVTIVNYAKFSQNPILKQKLMETGDRILVEASPYDRIWGIGLGVSADGIDDPKNWKGKNLLGKSLVSVRSMIRSDEGITTIRENT